MVSDAHEPCRVKGCGTAGPARRYFAADEINIGGSAKTGFGASFAGLADGELDELRLLFRRKALAPARTTLSIAPHSGAQQLSWWASAEGSATRT